MKHRTITIVLVTGLLLFFMVWSFGSSAANESKQPAEKGSNRANESSESSAVTQGEDEDEFVDADLGKWGSRSGIDRETYLRLRDEYIARRRGIEPGLPFDPSLRGRAIEQMERQEKNRKIESLINGSLTPPIGVDAAWTSLGPAPLPNGVGTNPASGRVTAIVVDPTNPNKVYLGTAQGGVWRSLNGGTTWESIFDNAQSLAIGALALAPSNPTILYVGTGESNRCGSCFFGAGLYRIDDVAGAFTLVGPIDPLFSFSSSSGTVNTNTFTGRAISSIVVSPTDPATIFVGTSTGIGGSGANSLSNRIPPIALLGVYRSTNATSAPGSITFQKLAVATGDTTSPQVPSTGNSRITDMIMEPGNDNNLIVGVFGTVPSANGIYRSTNAALAANPTFSQVQQISTDRIQFAINKDTNTGVVKVLAATSETPSTASCSVASSQQGVLRQSVDGGVTWPSTDATATTGGILTGAGGFCGGQCFYNVTVAIDPKNANAIYIGGNVNSTCSGLIKSSFNNTTSSFDGVTFRTDSSGLHADSHALFMDPLTTPTTVFAGNDGGVWKRSAGAAAVGSVWTNLNTAPLNTLQFEGIAVHPLDRNLMIGGTQDNGTEYQQTSPGNWSQAETGDGGYCLIDQSATNTTNVTMYHTFFNQTGTQIGFDRAVNTTCLPNKNFWPTRGVGFVPPLDLEQLSLSCDGTADYLHNGLRLTDNVLFYAPMALGPGSPNTVYFGTNRLYRSSDRGDSMTVVSQAPIAGTSPISTIAIWPQGDNVRMVGLQNGQVWATSTGSSTLVNITSGSFPTNPNGSTTNMFVGRAVIDPNNKNVAYISFSFFAPAGQGVWKITNLVAASGASPVTPVWTAAGNGIPSIPINSLVIDPINSNNIYAGTDIGVYVSTDGGANWSPFGTGLPRSAVFELAIQPSNRILRAGTHGRGVWETPLINPAASTVQFNTGSSSVNESQVSTTVTVTRSGDTSFPASVNYATSDSSGANNCNVNSGSGSSRCDCIATSGTLNFAANETSKTILVPIVDDAYTEGNESFTMTLSAAGGNNVTLGSPAAITITINANDPVIGPNQIDTASFFVREHYIDFLNREPDASGLNFWTNQITSCGSDQACIEVKRINVSAAFFLSIEFQETGYLVYRLYKAAYGDAPGTSTTGGSHSLPVPIIRLSEFLPDTQRIGQGVVVNVGNWQQQIEDNKQAFTEEFVQRSRFLAAYPLTMTPTDFVNGLNTKAGVALSPAERDQLVSDLTAGIKTRAQVLRAVAEDQTLVDAEKNRAFVLMQYFGYLRRNPNDPQDSDYAGYEFWLGKLNQFNGNFINAEMVKSFLVAGEYRQRFGTP